MSTDELVAHCSKAVESIGELLSDFSQSSIEKMTKRAMLISYWIGTYVNTFLTHFGKRLFLGTKSNHNRESNAPKIKMISGAVFRSDDGGIWP